MSNATIQLLDGHVGQDELYSLAEIRRRLGLGLCLDARFVLGGPVHPDGAATVHVAGTEPPRTSPGPMPVSSCNWTIAATTVLRWPTVASTTDRATGTTSSVSGGQGAPFFRPSTILRATADGRGDQLPRHTPAEGALDPAALLVDVGPRPALAHHRLPHLLETRGRTGSARHHTSAPRLPGPPRFVRLPRTAAMLPVVDIGVGGVLVG